MPFIPALNTARVELVGHENFQIIENVFHVKKGSALTLTDLSNIAEAVRDWWDTELQAFVADDVAMDKVLVRDMTTDSSPAIEFTSGFPLAGAATGVALPNNSTVAIKWVTGLAGRSFRGRTYHIGLTIDDLADNNHLDSSAQSTLAAAYEALIQAISDIGLTLVVASFFHGVDDDGKPIPRVTAVLTEITGTSVNATLDSQRRRLPERGM